MTSLGCAMTVSSGRSREGATRARTAGVCGNNQEHDPCGHPEVAHHLAHDSGIVKILPSRIVKGQRDPAARRSPQSQPLK